MKKNSLVEAFKRNNRFRKSIIIDIDDQGLCSKKHIIKNYRITDDRYHLISNDFYSLKNQEWNLRPSIVQQPKSEY